MFIREATKKNPGYDKKFIYHRLMESVRTPRGPRQRMLLNLGKLEIPKDEWKTLANRIEEMLSGQQVYVPPPQHIEDLARHYASLLVEKQLKSIPPSILEEEDEEWETVNLESMSQSHGRTIGGELLGNYAFCKLGFPKMLKSFGFNQEQIHHAALLVIGRLLHPASELETVYWAKNVSALGELLGTDFSHIRENSLYRASDLLMKHQDAIESHLARTERRLFGLNEKIILYDLTNTYLEGAFEGSKKAKRGYSKDKRKDCPLLTLALVVDEDGFPKGSKVFPGVKVKIIYKEIESDIYAKIPGFFNVAKTLFISFWAETKELKNPLFLCQPFICLSAKRKEPFLWAP